MNCHHRHFKKKKKERLLIFSKVSIDTVILHLTEIIFCGESGFVSDLLCGENQCFVDQLDR